MKRLLTAFLTALALTAAADNGDGALPANCVRDVVVRQQWPWSTTVTTTFRVDGLGAGDRVDVAFSGRVGDETITIPPTAVRGARHGLGNGTHHLEFNPADVPELVRRESVASFRAVLAPTRSGSDPATDPLYMIVDLEAATPAAAVSYLSRADILTGLCGSYTQMPAWIAPGSTPALEDCLIWTGVTDDVAYKTTKLVLRKVKAGTFMMGSLDGENGRAGYETREQRHAVTLTKDYWIAVFETTQKQYALVMADSGRPDPSAQKGDARPVERVSYRDVRGTSAGDGWPGSADVDADSFMGWLRAKTGRAFDLPTEAQWECACRAGTDTALNSGKNLTNENACPNFAEVGRYSSNQSDGRGGFTSYHTTVGSYRPNAWGLYDMHGNVWEWCRDLYMEELGTEAVTDPVGAASGTFRIQRGGTYGAGARYGRSAYRRGYNPASQAGDEGFRVVCSAEP